MPTETPPYLKNLALSRHESENQFTSVALIADAIANERAEIKGSDCITQKMPKTIFLDLAYPVAVKQTEELETTIRVHFSQAAQKISRILQQEHGSQIDINSDALPKESSPELPPLALIEVPKGANLSSALRTPTARLFAQGELGIVHLALTGLSRAEGVQATKLSICATAGAHAEASVCGEAFLTLLPSHNYANTRIVVYGEFSHLEVDLSSNGSIAAFGPLGSRENPGMLNVFTDKDARASFTHKGARPNVKYTHKGLGINKSLNLL